MQSDTTREKVVADKAPRSLEEAEKILQNAESSLRLTQVLELSFGSVTRLACPRVSIPVAHAPAE